MPLLVETLLLAAFAYLVGFGIGWVVFRPRRTGYLER